MQRDQLKSKKSFISCGHVIYKIEVRDVHDKVVRCRKNGFT